MSKYSFKLNFLYNSFFLFLFILSVKNEEIINEYAIDVGPREVCIEYLNISKWIKLRWNYFNQNILIFILSLGKIKIENIEKYNYLKKLSNYNYDAYYISDCKYYYLELKIHSLIYKIEEENQNRNYPLIIYTFEKNNYSYFLNIKENKPVFLYFNNDFKSYELLYNNNNIDQPIIVSFFTKEKIKYKIEISGDGKNIAYRTINYKENIIIKPDNSKAYNIFITPEGEDIMNSTMIVNIIQNNSPLIYLQKNQLNVGFIPIGVDDYYYYMEVFKGEEGEIILFNKRQNGILISKIVEKNNNITPIVTEFPKYNESNASSNDYLEFNIYNQN